MLDNKEKKEKKDELDKELENLINSEELSPEEIEELRKMFKVLKEGMPDSKPGKKWVMNLIGFFWRLLVGFIINTAALGFFFESYSFSHWYNILIYTAAVSLVSVIFRYIIVSRSKLLSNPLKGMVFRYGILLGCMIIFNLIPQNFLVFDSVVSIIFYALISIGLSQVANYYIYKFIIFR